MRRLLIVLAWVIALFLAGMVPWWTIWLIEPRPNRVMFGLAEVALGLRDPDLALIVGVLWINAAILGSELGGAYLLAYFGSRGRPLVGWLWGVAAGLTGLVMTLVDPLFQVVMPEVPGRVRYWPDVPPVAHLLRNSLLLLHLLAAVFVPQVGGLLGAAAARKRARRTLAAGATEDLG